MTIAQLYAHTCKHKDPKRSHKYLSKCKPATIPPSKENIKLTIDGGCILPLKWFTMLHIWDVSNNIHRVRKRYITPY
jgi:hypothetical protein